MRTSWDNTIEENYDEITQFKVEFVADLDNGHCLISCGCPDHPEYSTEDVGDSDEKFFCPYCYRELFYPRCDW